MAFSSESTRSFSLISSVEIQCNEPSLFYPIKILADNRLIRHSFQITIPEVGLLEEKRGRSGKIWEMSLGSHQGIAPAIEEEFSEIRPRLKL